MSNYDLALEDIDVFHYEEGSINFNDLCAENGFTYWYARDYMKMLGYQKYNSFKKPVNKAITTCMTLDIDVTDNFVQVNRVINGEEVKDYKLSRFACYLIAMNADGKKLEVARAQAFFAAAAETIRRYVSDASQVERVLIRDEISIHEKSLSGVAKEAGVEKYALFQNAGYRGMYNMNLSKLKDYKNSPDVRRTLLDYMGKDELAANLFRITQTELKMRNENIKGQRNSENAAEQVGRKVRKTMIEIGGIAPEDMELEEDIKKIKTSLKQTHKGLKKIDD
ncbi:BRO family protein [Psychrobacter lutiphocae]|uniref:BRO family protein n=1 Tax=Psychrobacter lutiphocae TaxID=540500 RepID=UPI00037C4369|nr:BRO family protein [Psychrobacter lutiphocae]